MHLQTDGRFLPVGSCASISATGFGQEVEQDHSVPVFIGIVEDFTGFDEVPAFRVTPLSNSPSNLPHYCGHFLVLPWAFSNSLFNYKGFHW